MSNKTDDPDDLLKRITAMKCIVQTFTGVETKLIIKKNNSEPKSGGDFGGDRAGNRTSLILQSLDGSHTGFSFVLFKRNFFEMFEFFSCDTDDTADHVKQQQPHYSSLSLDTKCLQNILNHLVKLIARSGACHDNADDNCFHVVMKMFQDFMIIRAISLLDSNKKPTVDTLKKETFGQTTNDNTMFKIGFFDYKNKDAEDTANEILAPFDNVLCFSSVFFTKTFVETCKIAQSVTDCGRLFISIFKSNTTSDNVCFELTSESKTTPVSFCQSWMLSDKNIILNNIDENSRIKHVFNISKIISVLDKMSPCFEKFIFSIDTNGVLVLEFFDSDPRETSQNNCLHFIFYLGCIIVDDCD